MPAIGARRDPAFIRAHLEQLAWLVERYHHSVVDGFAHLPTGPALIVGNHNGGIMAPDMYALMVAWWRHAGVDVPTYGLAHDLGFRIPGVRDLLGRLGAVPANPANGLALLADGHKVLVYPGGELDAYRPASRSHLIEFGERTGFVRLALRAGVPIVPVVSVGAHASFHVISDGRTLVARLGLARHLRVSAVPLILCAPWGVAIGATPFVPLPVKMRLRVLPPIAWPELSASAADDPSVLARCRDEVRVAMQRGLDVLAASGDHGVTARFARQGA